MFVLGDLPRVAWHGKEEERNQMIGWDPKTEVEKTQNEDLFYKGSSANLPCLHTCENKVPFWDFK